MLMGSREIPASSFPVSPGLLKNCFFFNFENVFIYFCLHWVFVATLRLSLVTESSGSSIVAVCGLLVVVASLVVGSRVWVQ